MEMTVQTCDSNCCQELRRKNGGLRKRHVLFDP